MSRITVIRWTLRGAVAALVVTYLAVGIRFVLSSESVTLMEAYRAGIALAVVGGFCLLSELIQACYRDVLDRQATAKDMARGAVEAVLEVGGDDGDATVHQLYR